MFLEDDGEQTHKNSDTTFDLQSETRKASNWKKQIMEPCSSRGNEECTKNDDENSSKLETREPASSQRKSCATFHIGRPLPAAPILPSIHNPAPPVAPILVPSLGVKRHWTALGSESESQKRLKMGVSSSSLPTTAQHDLAAIALSEMRFLNHRDVVPSQHPLPPPPTLVSAPPPT